MPQDERPTREEDARFCNMKDVTPNSLKDIWLPGATFPMSKTHAEIFGYFHGVSNRFIPIQYTGKTSEEEKKLGEDEKKKVERFICQLTSEKSGYMRKVDTKIGHKTYVRWTFYEVEQPQQAE